MSSIDISQIPAIVARDAYHAMFQAYNAEPVIYPMLCDMHDAPPGMLGDKGSVISGLGDMKRVLDGEEIKADTVKGTYTWRCAVNRYAGRIDIPKRMLDAADASGKVTNMITQFASQWGRRAPTQKEQIIADILQKGTLSAGDKTVFNGSFPNETDANLGLIFDGKPFFAATGNGHPLLADTATPFNLTAASTLTQANIQANLTAMRVTNAVDDRGIKIVIRPTHLIVPSGLEFTAKTILNSTLLSGTANNDVNPIAGALTPITWRYLTDDTDAWWTAALGQGGGIRAYDSGAPVIEQFYDVKTKTLIVTAEFMFGAHVQDWRQWYANNKATS